MAPNKEASSLKRGRQSVGEEASDLKKPRRSDRISSQGNHDPTTPLKNNTQLPSPLTHAGSTVTEQLSDSTKSKDLELPETTRPPTLPPSPPSGIQDSSPIADTQAFSQFSYPPKAIAPEVEDEEAEGVWGYLLPADSRHGGIVVLKKRNACPAPQKPLEITNPTSKSRRQSSSKTPRDEEHEYEETKIAKGLPSGGYLVGRHPECDLIVDIPTISNRHFVIFPENKRGDTIAVLEDISSNGTEVNDGLVGRNQTRELEDGDEIVMLNEARFVFRYPASKNAAHGFKTQYRILQQLGKGHFASVYLCVERATGHKYAVKRFERRQGDSQRSQQSGLQQEIAVLMSVSHPNVLCLKESFDEADGVYLVLELAPEGELFNHIVMKSKLSEAETRKIFVQLFQGIKYLHERSIVHRDIKPENILLVDKALSVKLADFGLAKIIGEESFTTTLCGTPSYVAPEILKNTRHRKYTRAVDVWSLGVVLYICLCGFPPFSDELYTEENPYRLADQIKTGRFDYPSPYWDHVGDPALDLIDRMLTVDVEKRITIDECLEHPWVNQKYPGVGDSADSLAGAFDSLDFSARKMHRERTLLASINDVKVTQLINAGSDTITAANKDAQPQIKVFQKNPKGKTPAPTEETRQPQTKPDANRAVDEFIEIGGKGDAELFADTSYYPAANGSVTNSGTKVVTIVEEK